MDIFTNLATAMKDLSGFPKSTQIYRVHNLQSFTFEDTAEQLVAFISKHYGITLSEITLDFIKDLKGNEWLITCKGFRVVDKQDLE